MSDLIINRFHINKTRVKWRAIITVIVITIRPTKGQYSKHYAVQGLHWRIVQSSVRGGVQGLGAEMGGKETTGET